jgi:hypothetical protein
VLLCTHISIISYQLSAQPAPTGSILNVSPSSLEVLLTESVIIAAMGWNTSKEMEQNYSNILNNYSQTLEFCSTSLLFSTVVQEITQE